MFEDQQKKEEPKDIFEDVPEDEGPLAAMQGPLGAPLEDRPSALASGLIKPARVSLPTDIPPLPEEEVPVIKEPFMRRWKLIVFILLIILIVAGGIYIFYRKITTGGERSSAPPKAEEPAPTPEAPAASEPSIFDQDVTPPPAPVLPEQPKDTDQDGLTDNEEVELGIDPFSTDTDKDGLTDREEVLVWRTDPKNPDTDGDTFIDGEEVSNGYRPDGPGKLFS